MDRLISEEKVLDIIFCTIEKNDPNSYKAIRRMIKAIPPAEPIRDMKEIEEVINCDADAETKCKMISNILTAKPYYFEEQEPKTGHWIMRHRKVNTINYRTGEDVLTGEIHTVKELIRYETDEPYCAGCGKRAEDISQGYCGYCGARMVKEQESKVSE